MADDLAIPMLLAIQAMSARIGDSSHQDLGVTIQENFPRPIAYLTLAGLCITTILMIGGNW